MILLDTNVVSEFMKPAPNICVQRWLDLCAEPDLFICAPVVAELFYGVAILPTGKKKLACSLPVNALSMKYSRAGFCRSTSARRIGSPSFAR